MIPSVALVVYIAVLLLLLRLSKDPLDSPALWIPVVWILTAGSRLPSQWIGQTATSVAARFEEGSPLDRTFYLTLIVLSLWVLTRRHLNWGELFARNSALVLFLVFAFVSITWSDYPYVTFKRWIRDLGMYLMVLVVVSDPRPMMAVSTVIRRVSYILIGASILLIKYYPQLGVAYDPYEGIPEYTGVTTSKSQLGVICLVSGLFFFWDTLVRWPERKGRGVKPLILANIIFIGIMFRLLMLSNSATSLGCLVIGCLILVVLHSNWAKANPRIVTASIPVVLALYIVLVFVFDISSLVARLFGRDPTLTGRTNIWAALLAAQTNPLLGVGYQTFWMGDRMAAVLRSLHVTNFLNEAHNGYLEMYLNLGYIGLALLVLFLFSGCRSICRQLNVFPYFASFALMFWMVSLVYNFTESAFGSSFPWMILLLCVVVVPRLDEVPSQRTEFVVKRRTTNPQRYGSRQEDGGIPSRRSVIRGGTSPGKL